jgi:hypothetical protein
MTDPVKDFAVAIVAAVDVAVAAALVAIVLSVWSESERQQNESQDISPGVASSHAMVFDPVRSEVSSSASRSGRRKLCCPPQSSERQGKPIAIGNLE